MELTLLHTGFLEVLSLSILYTHQNIFILNSVQAEQIDKLIEGINQILCQGAMSPV